jgi:hypothetical protein
MGIIILHAASLVSFISLLIYLVPRKELMESVFYNCSYYIVLALVLLWLFLLLRLWREKNPNLRTFFTRHGKAIAFSFLLTAITFISVTKSLRILSDETNFLSVSNSMTFEKKTRNLIEGIYHYERFVPYSWSVEKRPLLFPFFTSIIHTLTGQRAENVFVLNFAALWGALFLLYMLIRFYLSEISAYAALILVISQPMVALCATSGGMETLNLFFLAACFLILQYFLMAPSALLFSILVINLTMLSNVRYESGLFMFMILCLLGVRGYVKIDYLRLKWLAFLPFFFLSWILQRILTVNDSDIPGGTWSNAFRLDFIYKNIIEFGRCVFNLYGDPGFAGLVNIIGAIATLWLIFIFITNFNLFLKERQSFILILIISLFASFIVPLSYHDSISHHPLNGRFYLPVLTLFSILPVFILAQFIKETKHWVLLVIAIFIFLYYHPVAIQDNLTKNLFIYREQGFVEEFLKKNADKNALIILGRPGQLVATRRGAIYFHTANKDVKNILQQHKNHLYSAIYVVQPIAYQGWKPMDYSVIDSRYNLKPMSELQINGEYFFRISKVIPSEGQSQ